MSDYSAVSLNLEGKYLVFISTVRESFLVDNYRRWTDSAYNLQLDELSSTCIIPNNSYAT